MVFGTFSCLPQGVDDFSTAIVFHAYSKMSTVVRSSLDLIASLGERKSATSMQAPWTTVGLVALAAASGACRAQFGQIAITAPGRLRAVGNQINVCFTMISDSNDLVNAATWIGGNEWFERTGMTWLVSESMSIASVPGGGVPYVSIEPHADDCHKVIAYWMDPGGWIQITPPTLQSGCSLKPSNVKTALSQLPANVSGDTGYAALWQNDHSDGSPTTVHAVKGAITHASNINAIYVGPFEIGIGIEPSVFDSHFALLDEARQAVTVGKLDAYNPSVIKKIIESLPRTFFYIHRPQIFKTSKPNVVFLIYETAPTVEEPTRSIDGAFVNIIDGTVEYALQIAGSQNEDGMIYHAHSSDYFESEGYLVTYRVGDRMEGVAVSEYGEKSLPFLINQTPIHFEGRAQTALFLSDNTRACSAWETSNTTVVRRVWPIVHRPPSGRTTYPPMTLKIPEPIEMPTTTRALATTAVNSSAAPISTSPGNPSSYSNRTFPTDFMSSQQSTSLAGVAAAIAAVVVLFFLIVGGAAAVALARSRRAVLGTPTQSRDLAYVSSKNSVTPAKKSTSLAPPHPTADTLPQVIGDSRSTGGAYGVVPNGGTSSAAHSLHVYDSHEAPMDPEHVYADTDEPLA
ncbi:MAG: hypothetical protein S4CHLAM2_18790 [Chlamydiales bacterium]|nr:hypothetical protein [Chlamydiales bacterium]